MRFKATIFGALFSLISNQAIADHNCNWLRSSGANILVNLYQNGNASFVRDSLVERGVSNQHATRLVEAVSASILPSSLRQTADYCEYRRTAPSNGGLGEVFGTGPMNFNACMAEYGMSEFYSGLIESFANCEGAGNLLSAIGH